jgi:hypothetical protein
MVGRPVTLRERSLSERSEVLLLLLPVNASPLTTEACLYRGRLYLRWLHRGQLCRWWPLTTEACLCRSRLYLRWLHRGQLCRWRLGVLSQEVVHCRGVLGVASSLGVPVPVVDSADLDVGADLDVVDHHVSKLAKTRQKIPKKVKKVEDGIEEVHKGNQ